MRKNPKPLNSVIVIICSITAFAMLFTFTQGNRVLALDNPAPQTLPQAAPQAQQLPPQVPVQAPVANPVPGNAVNQTMPQKNPYALAQQPQQNGFQDAIYKFLMAMLGVILSSLAIFLGLKLYQKFVLKKSSKFDNIKNDKTLESPKDFKEAINIFLDKTEK